MESRTAAPASVYPVAWASRMCTAWEQLAPGAPGSGLGRVQRALTALALTPSWPPGTEARDQLIEYFKLLDRRTIDEMPPPSAGSPDAIALQAALEEARSALARLETETGEALQCADGVVPA